MSPVSPLLEPIDDGAGNLIGEDIRLTSLKPITLASPDLSLTDPREHPPPPSYQESAHLDGAFNPTKKFAKIRRGYISRRFQRKKTGRGARDPNILRIWRFEILCWFLALIFFCVVIGILGAFSGHNPPHWRYGITLGALVSVFTSLGASVLMLPLGSAMGQLKWMWFLEARPLVDFETMTQASTGPIGSFVLIATGRGGLFATFGALLMIAQLAIGPFTQQIIQYQALPQTESTGNASIFIAREYDGSAPGPGGVVANNLVDHGYPVELALSMKAAITNAVLDPGAPSSNFDIIPTCTTGNCTWPTYRTLAVCRTCEDLSDKVTQTVNTSLGNVKFGLPNGQTLLTQLDETYDGMASISIVGLDTVSVVFSKNRASAALLDLVVIIGASDYGSGVTTPPMASECLLEVCVQTLSSNTTNNTLLEAQVSSPEILVQDQDTAAFTSTSGNLSMPWLQAWLPLNDYLASTFNATTVANLSSTQDKWPSEVAQSVFTAMNGTEDNPPVSLDTLMANIAKSMTRAMRMQQLEPTFGVASAEQTFVLIVWVWITLPIVVLFAVLALLIAVAIMSKSRQLPKWKDDSLPTLFYGLDDVTRRKAAVVGHAKELKDTAKGMAVRIRRDDDSWGLKQVSTVKIKDDDEEHSEGDV